MEENKQWKQLPFTIELAKKIQAGEIEGRIMRNGKTGGEEIIVLSYDYEKYRRDYPIRFVYVNHDEIDYLHNTSSLFIELPEETDNTTITDDWYKTEDVKGKIELLASKMGLTYEQFIIMMDSLKGIIKINGNMMQLLDDMKDDIERICETPICNNPDSPICKVCSNIHCNDCQYNTPKHEFKPFDKVLVRGGTSTAIQERNIWVPAYYQHHDYSRYVGDDEIYFASGLYWKECLPYEGNEHLIGKTDKPE